MHYFVIAVRCMLGVVFLVSSVSKLAGRTSFNAFVSSLRGTRLFPASIVRHAAVGVVTAEAGIFLLMAVPAAAMAVSGFAAAAGLLASFTVGVGLAVKRNVRVACQCFGPSSAQLGFEHVARNAFLAAAAAAASAASGVAAPSSAKPGGTIVAAAAGAATGCVVVALDDIIRLFLPVNVQLSTVHDTVPVQRRPHARHYGRSDARRHALPARPDHQPWRDQEASGTL